MKLRSMIQGAFSCAIIFIITAFISLPLGNVGYINLGDAVIMLAATLVSPPLAFLVAAIGSSMSDLYLGFPQYIFFTFLIKGIEAFAISRLLYKREAKHPWSFILGGLIVVVGYACADIILTQNIQMGLLSMSFNSVQAICSTTLAFLLYQPFQSFIKKNNIVM